MKNYYNSKILKKTIITIMILIRRIVKKYEILKFYNTYKFNFLYFHIKHLFLHYMIKKIKKYYKIL